MINNFISNSAIEKRHWSGCLKGSKLNPHEFINYYEKTIISIAACIMK